MNKTEPTEEERTKAREYARAYYAAHKEEKRAYRKAYREKNPEQMKQSEQKWRDANRDKRRAIERAWWAKNPGKKSEYARKSAYGLKPGQYAEMVAAQGGLCAICKLQRELVVDHDHATGEIRGLLCQCCNRAIGLIKESPERLRAAAQYLERSANEGAKN